MKEQPVQKKFKITTPREQDGKYVVPEDDTIPKRYWGYRASSPIISWTEKVLVKERIMIEVLGDPLAQKRHRVASIPGESTGFRQYDPGASDKGDFLKIVQSNAPAIPFNCALRVDCFFYFSRPKAHYKTGKNSHILKDNAPVWKTSKPDRDNLDKFILDALNTIFWKDDGVVCAGEIIKQYSDKPRTLLIITEL